MAFLANTGAEITLVGPDSLSLLTSIGTAPARTVPGFNGALQMPLQTGYLVIDPPLGATAKPPLEGPCAITFGDFKEYRCSRVGRGASRPFDPHAAAVADIERALAGVAGDARVEGEGDLEDYALHREFGNPEPAIAQKFPNAQASEVFVLRSML